MFLIRNGDYGEYHEMTKKEVEQIFIRLELLRLNQIVREGTIKQNGRTVCILNSAKNAQSYLYAYNEATP